MHAMDNISIFSVGAFLCNSQHETYLYLDSLCSLGLSANLPAVFFSHIKPTTSQPAIFFFDNKSAPVTSHSQS
jgi:hypothetical protein